MQGTWAASPRAVRLHSIFPKEDTGRAVGVLANEGTARRCSSFHFLSLSRTGEDRNCAVFITWSTKLKDTAVNWSDDFDSGSGPWPVCSVVGKVRGKLD